MSVLEITAEQYHADPAPAPSLSSSIAQKLCNESPLHAWTAHPKLNPAAKREYSEGMDLGSICHALVLEGSTDKVHQIQATKTEGSGKNKVDTGIPVDDWRTGAAKQERDEARAAGKFPILQCDWPAVEAMHAAAQAQMKAFKIDLAEGESEKTLMWQEANGVWCRARLDWLSHDKKRIIDYKTTAGTANPDVVSRTLFAMGYDIQEAFYRRGVRALFGTEPTFRFVYQETAAPCAMSVLALAGDSQMLADKKAYWAIETFGECLKSGVWPGYPQGICYATLQPWMEPHWLEKETREL